jgi:hypothetical protein
LKETTKELHFISSYEERNKEAGISKYSIFFDKAPSSLRSRGLLYLQERQARFARLACCIFNIPPPARGVARHGSLNRRFALSLRRLRIHYAFVARSLPVTRP